MNNSIVKQGSIKSANREYRKQYKYCLEIIYQNSGNTIKAWHSNNRDELVRTAGIKYPIDNYLYKHVLLEVNQLNGEYRSIDLMDIEIRFLKGKTSLGQFNTQLEESKIDWKDDMVFA